MPREERPRDPKKVTINIPGSHRDSRSAHSRDSGIAPAGEDYHQRKPSYEEAYKYLDDKNRELKAKCLALDEQLSSKNKFIHEIDARWKAEVQHNQALKEQLDESVRNGEAWRQKCRDLEEQLAITQEHTHHARHERRSKSSTPSDEPIMRGGVVTPPKPSRRDSVRDKGKQKEVYKEDKDLQSRLKGRFEHNDAAPARPRRRRDSYVEEMGPAASRSFSRVDVAKRQPATMARVPMTTAASDASYGPGRYDTQYEETRETGEYQFYPLPTY